MVTKSTKAMKVVLGVLFALIILVGGYAFLSGESSSGTQVHEIEENPFG